MVNFGGAASTDDQLGPPPRPQPMRVSRIVALINNLVDLTYSAGDDAEAAHRTVREELHAQADEAVIELARLEADCDRHAYPRRWALIYVAAQLEHDATLPFLRKVVLTPIPLEESPNPHFSSTVKEETVLRTAAVEGIGALAMRGNARATESLFEFLSIDSISIRRASVQTLLAVDKGMRDRIAEYLTPDSRYLLDVRPLAVTDVPQVDDPRKHLRESQPREKHTPPDPLQGMDGPFDQAGPRTGA
ncbi:MAG: hypothetical protein IH873_07445 [Chloroflexi bacterium]|nr:hypothetical protein [Chloroflexota bacterium]